MILALQAAGKAPDMALSETKQAAVASAANAGGVAAVPNGVKTEEPAAKKQKVQ